MIRSPEELIKPIKEAVNRKAVVFSHLLLAGTATTQTLLDPAAFTYEKIGIVIISLILVLLAFFRVFDLASINSRPKAYLVVYHIIISVGFAVISYPSTPYVPGYEIRVLTGYFIPGPRLKR